jgi:hypothetical protein
MTDFLIDKLPFIVPALWLALMLYGMSRPYKGPITQQTSGAFSVYKGSGIGGFPLLTRFGDSIYEGASQAGFPLFTVSGNALYRGASGVGFPVATVDSGGYVMEGAIGKYLGIIVGNSVYRFEAEDRAALATSNDKMLLAAALVVLL